jgi:CubicO group peptidase (beta-lactamase class C family)
MASWFTIKPAEHAIDATFSKDLSHGVHRTIEEIGQRAIWMSGKSFLRYDNAQDVGMDPNLLKGASDLIKRAILQNAFPGATFLIARKGVIVAHEAQGSAVSQPPDMSRPMKLDTIYDLGSITKPLATATSLMILLERGQVLLSDGVSRYIPEYVGGKKDETTLCELLTHTSGLPSWKPLYEICRGREDFLHGICRMDLEYAPGEKVVYSCLGYILLTFILEKVMGEGLSSFARREIFLPLGMKDTLFNPPKELRDRIAATERCKWRGRMLIGEVHDENAFGMGGVSGNAGLFSTALDLAIFAQTFLNGGEYGGARVLSPSSVKLMIENHTVKLDEPRGLGWALKSKMGSSAGDLLSDSTFGHTGFPGGSLWIDPVNELIIVLLTNRVHPTRENDAILRVRPPFHNIIASSIVA